MKGMDWKLGLLCAVEAITAKKAAWFRVSWRMLEAKGMAPEYSGDKCYDVMAEWVLAGAPEDESLLRLWISMPSADVSQARPDATDDGRPMPHCEHEWHLYGTINGVKDWGCQKCGAQFAGDKP